MSIAIRGTTILALKRKGEAVVGGDGQVTLGDMVVKERAKKVRKLYKGKVLAGFAGSAADALTLFDRFESKLEEHKGQLARAAIELAKDWRMDRALRRLEAMLVALDMESLLLISGSGDVIEPDGEIVGIGSGGGYAMAAGRALLAGSKLPGEELVRRSLEVAAGLCIYTNDKISIESLKRK
jgi:ATP-dependent HslUV protease subunit HslV